MPANHPGMVPSSAHGTLAVPSPSKVCTYVKGPGTEVASAANAWEQTAATAIETIAIAARTECREAGNWNVINVSWVTDQVWTLLGAVRSDRDRFSKQESFVDPNLCRPNRPAVQ